MSRSILAEATGESADGYSLTVKARSEDKTLGEPCVANRGAVDVAVTAADGTVISFRLPGEQAELLVLPIVQGAIEHESEADIARRYLRDAGHWLTPEQTADLKRRAGEE